MSPFGKERVAATYAKEILRKVTGSELAENSVVDGRSVPLNADSRRILESGTVMVYEGQSEQQRVVVDATGGTFTLTHDGQTTTGIAENATATVLQAALEALSNLVPGDVSVTGPAGGPWVVDFSPLLGNVGQMTGSGASLTGGAATVTITTTRAYVAPAVGQKVKPAPSSGVTSGEVAGVVMHTTEFWPDTTERDKDDAAVALFTTNCHFEVSKLLGYSGNATAVKAAMTGAGNGRCSNCSFE